MKVKAGPIFIAPPFIAKAYSEFGVNNLFLVKRVSFIFNYTPIKYIHKLYASALLSLKIESKIVKLLVLLIVYIQGLPALNLISSFYMLLF